MKKVILHLTDHILLVLDTKKIEFLLKNMKIWPINLSNIFLRKKIFSLHNMIFDIVLKLYFKLIQPL